MGADRPKQYLTILDHYLLDITLQRLLEMHPFAGCIVPLHPDDAWWADSVSATDPRITTCLGGAERSQSVLAALQLLEDLAQDNDWVLVHDMARPCLDADDLKRLIGRLRDEPVGGLLATRVTDTLKRSDGAGRVAQTVDRSSYWRALTPQMFRLGILRDSLEQALAKHAPVTDESSAVETLRPGESVLVEGRADNLKVTVPGDIELAAFILQRSGWAPSTQSLAIKKDDRKQ